MRRFLSLVLVLCCSIFSLFYRTPSILSDGTYTSLGTADSADGSNDALNFSQGRVWTIDQYGKYIWLTQARGPTSHWAWSNDSGANWSQGSESYSFLTRGSVAYDSINDVLHVIWEATDSNDGIIYRRYSITRDGSNNITAISRVDSGTVNLQLDTSASRTLVQPVAIWVNDGSADGTLVAIWSKSGSSLNEVRGSMRTLSMTGNDGTAGNWVALDGTADTFSTDAPAVAADKIYNDTSGTNSASASIRGGTGSRKDDLYVFVAESDDNSADSVLGYRAIWNSSSSDWSGGWQSPVTVGAMDTSSGYTLKEQLITKPVLDADNDRLYVGWARWKSGGDGDTASFAYLNSSDTASSTFDAYASLGTHSYAPTLDIAYDDTLDDLYVSYVESTTNGTNGSIDYKTFDGTTLGSQTRFYTTPGGSAGANGSADIPILYEARSSNDRLLFAFRINGALPPTAGDPHTIDWGYITLGAAPTPTPTPSASSTSQPPVVYGLSSTTDPPSCNASTPPQTPDLFQIDAAGTFANLYFTTVTSSTSGYQISYGLDQNSNNYSDSFGYSGNEWIISRVIGGLSPNTTYYFKIRATNGCNAGNWSKTVQIKTRGRLADISSSLAKLNPLAKLPTPPTIREESTDESPVSCEYAVQPGDSLWSISQKVLGSGVKFKELKELNKNILPSFDLINIGLKIKVC